MSDRLIKQRVGHRAYFSKLHTDLVNKLPTLNASNVTVFKAEFTLLQERFHVIGELNTQILDRLDDGSEIQSEIEKAGNLMHELLLKIAEIKNVIEKVEPPSIAAPSSLSTPKVIQSAKLPKLSLMSFDGEDIRLWPQFWDIFKSEVHDQNICDSTKFRYLMNCLKGKAKSRVSHYLPSRQGYLQLVEKLMTEFGSDHKIKQSHVDSLNSASLRSENVKDLRSFFDAIQYDVTSLENHGMSPHSYGDFIIPTLLKQLPAPIQMKILDSTKGLMPDLDEFLELFALELKKREQMSDLNVGFGNLLSDKPNYVEQQTATVLTSTVGKNISYSNSHKTKSSDHLFQNKICIFCDESSHITRDCSLPAIKKYEIVVSKKLCFKCLGRHFASRCSSKKRCALCKGSHHSSLHSHYAQKSQSATITTGRANNSTNPSSAKNDSRQSTSMSIVSNSVEEPSVLLKTATAQVSVRNRVTKANLFFDEGSQLSYITRDFATKIGSTLCDKITLQINSFGGKTHETISDVAKFDVVTEDGPISTSAVIVPSIVDPIDQGGWSTYAKIPEFQNLNFADNYTSNHFQVDILIGADQAWRFIRPDDSIVLDGLVAQNSSVGYLLFGNPVPSTVSKTTCALAIAQGTETKEFPRLSLDLHQMVERMFQLDHLGIQDLNSISDEEFDAMFKSKISFATEHQQYVAPLPWKHEHPPLPTNFSQSAARLTQLRDRLQLLGLFRQYAQVIETHEAKGFVEKVPDTDVKQPNGGTHYLPHFYVLKPTSSSTPLRVVFAANSGKISLNDCLETGPCLLNNLSEILIKFRIHTYAFTADITKAFLNILIAEEDRDFLRFLWFENHDPNGRIVHFRYRCLNFGPTCAPYILNATIRKHLEGKPSWVTKDMHDKLYVDNLVSGTDSESEAVQYHIEATEVCAEAKMPLCQWLSNSSKLMTKADEAGTGMPSNSANVLGIQWNANDDVLYFPSKQFTFSDDTPHTKRSILSRCSSLYDPFGFLTPIMMPIKFLLSQLWEAEYDWDVTLPTVATEQFDEKLSEIQTASDNFRIPRRFDTDHSRPAEIHVFCDASFSGLGSVVYIAQDEKTAFVMSKLQIVSKKKRATLTVPKLELMAMLLGAKLLNTCIKYMRSEYPSLIYFCWTDSEICLHWLRSSSHSNVFVRNRVRQILELTDVATWSHVSSEDNPADIITRGSTFDLLMSSRFYCGPTWLTDKPSRPPPFRASLPVEMADDEKVTTTICAATVTPSPDNLFDLSRFSSYQKLLATVTLVLRFIDRTRRRAEPPVHLHPTATELVRSEETIIRLLQNKEFSEEKTCLSSGSSHKKQALVRQLNLFLDNRDILRAAGRFANANISDSAKCPILVPKNSDLTKLLIRHFHEFTHHGGVNTTLSIIRQQFWIPCGRAQVKKVIRTCVTCIRQTGRTIRLPERPALPSFRVNDLRPFSTIGIDFSGHLMVKNEPAGTLKKVYFCIFTCCTTRNINVELVESMSTESFLLAFRAHCADFSFPTFVVCDNAPTFKQSANEIQEMLNLVWSSEISTFLGEHRVSLVGKNTIQFRNIPVKAPWWGGFYERCVGLIKMSLKKTLGRSCISISELRVLLKEIRSTLNDRPITYIASDESDLGVRPLSPSLRSPHPLSSSTSHRPSRFCFCRP